MTRRTPSAASARSSTDLRRLTTAAVATALVFLFTFLIKVPTVIGYIHLGDAFVLLYAALTGDPLALLVGALGEGLADVAGGYFQYAPATMLIKALIALPVVLSARNGPSEDKDRSKVLTAKTFLWSLPSVPITLGGYFLIDYLLSGAYAYAALWTNAVQAGGSLLVFVVLALGFEKSRIGERLR
ncbi:MAG: ECF transporter S component [Clostridia bacterium]|nr:ECF transporter S component [Clostridia bacterium]MBQ8925340.1 ECF transporter S component [Clostridia bacterium]